MFGAAPEDFLGIFRQALFKPGSLFYIIDYVKKILKFFPYLPPYLYLTCNRKHRNFLRPNQQQVSIFQSLTWPDRGSNHSEGTPQQDKNYETFQC